MKLRYCEKKEIYFDDLSGKCNVWHYDEFGQVICESEENNITVCWPGSPGCPLVCDVLSMDPDVVIVDKEMIYNER